MKLRRIISHYFSEKYSSSFFILLYGTNCCIINNGIIDNNIIDYAVKKYLLNGEKSMANRNHELDKPIIEAAKTEFLLNGFQAASIGNIAKRAGVTTGAIYTRYKGKDELFHSLLEEFLKVLDKESKNNRKSYMKYCIEKDLDKFLNSIEKEIAGYIDILFEYYAECKLLLCKSKGSSVETLLDEMMKNKVSETKTFIKKNIASDISKIKLDLVELLIKQQFNVYTLVIEKGYSRDETIEYIKMLGEFIGAGWERLFKDLMIQVSKV